MTLFFHPLPRNERIHACYLYDYCRSTDSPVIPCVLFPYKVDCIIGTSTILS